MQEGSTAALQRALALLHVQSVQTDGGVVPEVLRIPFSLASSLMARSTSQASRAVSFKAFGQFVKTGRKGECSSRKSQDARRPRCVAFAVQPQRLESFQRAKGRLSQVPCQRPLKSRYVICPSATETQSEKLASK